MPFDCSSSCSLLFYYFLYMYQRIDLHHDMGSEQAKKHARLLPNHDSRRNSVFCRHKGRENVPWNVTLKTVYGPTSSRFTPLFSADKSTFLTDKDAILERWAELFINMLNRPLIVTDNVINDCQRWVQSAVYEFLAVIKARKDIHCLSSGASSDKDAFPVVIYKAGWLPMAESLQS